MTFTPEILRRKLDELVATAPAARRYIVAFSGGLDSTVLLHALAACTERELDAVLAVHVDHGLHTDSASWAAHCEAFAAGLGVDYAMRQVTVDRSAEGGLEAAARHARYAALRSFIEPGDWLLSGHHQDDQAETLLLNLMRASGPAGLAGIAPVRRFAAGWLVRPLLDTPRDDLEAYAESLGLDYVEDPSNLDQLFDRNYLRHEILPRLEQRWPDAAGRIRRSSELARDAAGLLAQRAAEDCDRLGDRSDRLSIAGLTALSPARQRNVLRHAIGELGLPVPGAARIESILSDLLTARPDAQPLVAWPGGEARRYRDRLYLLPASAGRIGPDRQAVEGLHMPLEHGLGALVFEPGSDYGLSDALVEDGLEVRYRVGGEEIRPYGQRHTKKLKKLLQESGVVPWMRERLPLVYSSGRLVAVADLWLADDAAAAPGTAVRWQNRPAID